MSARRPQLEEVRRLTDTLVTPSGEAYLHGPTRLGHAEGAWYRQNVPRRHSNIFGIASPYTAWIPLTHAHELAHPSRAPFSAQDVPERSAMTGCPLENPELPASSM